MKNAWFMGLAGLALAGCASTPPPDAANDTSARAAACVTTTERIYFDLESQALPPASAPILQAVMERIRGCEAQGGALTQLNIVAFPDSSETGGDADNLARERADAVRDALVSLGAPRAKVQTISHREVAEDPNRVLRRHATIGVVME